MGKIYILYYWSTALSIEHLLLIQPFPLPCSHIIPLPPLACSHLPTTVTSVVTTPPSSNSALFPRCPPLSLLHHHSHSLASSCHWCHSAHDPPHKQLLVRLEVGSVSFIIVIGPSPPHGHRFQLKTPTIVAHRARGGCVIVHCPRTFWAWYWRGHPSSLFVLHVVWNQHHTSTLWVGARSHGG